MKRRKTHRNIRHTIAVFAIIFGFISASIWIVSSPQALRYALTIANSRSSWKIEIKDFNWSPLRSRLEIKELALEDPEKGKRISIDGVDIGYKVLGFLRGKLVIDKLEVDGAKLILPGRKKRSPKKKGKLNLAELILLKNIEIKNGLIKQVSASLGGGKDLEVDEVRISLSPSFFSGTKLSIRVDGLLYRKAEKLVASTGMFQLTTSTRLSEWSDEFPYIDSLGGTLKLRDSLFSGIMVDTLKAKVYYNDKKLELTELKIDMDGRELSGKLTSNIADQKFDLSIDIDKPIHLPHFGKPLKVLALGGNIQGKIRLSGRGYSLKQNSGRGSIDITHTFDADKSAPLSIKTSAKWKGGRITLGETSTKLGKNDVFISGSIDIPGKEIDLKVKAEKIELGDVFKKFRNPHLQRIFGRANIDGIFGGWGKNFSTRVHGLVSDGGWVPISIDGADLIFEATYNELGLVGDIISDGEKTGHADLKIEFGPKIKNLDRSKKITLTANLDKHPLDETMAAFDLKGVATGKIKLIGPPKSFTGESQAEIVEGSWHGVPFDTTSTKISLSRRMIEFSDLRFKPKVFGALELPGKIFLGLPGNKVTLKGKPTPNLELDMGYAFTSRRWHISGIEWKNDEGMQVSAKGNMTSEGPIDLKISGNTDLSTLRPFTFRFLDGRGPVEIDLSFKGSSSDPRIYGDLSFEKARIIMRSLGLSFEKIDGGLHFNDHTVVAKGINANSGDGVVKIEGQLNHKKLKPTYVDMSMGATSMIYRSPDRTLMLEFEGDLSLKGNFPDPLLKGGMLILDGKYSKDFKILEAMSEKNEPRQIVEPDKLKFNPRLDLRVKSSGELEIENNVGDIWLNANVEVKGNALEPTVAGAITSSGGEIHYLGLQFDISTGFVEFRERYEKPHLEIHAEKEIDIYNVNLTLYGTTDNLKLDLNATSPAGPLEKRDVVSLLIFGVTEEERMEAAERTGGKFTASMVAQSITGAIQRPITKLTRLDVFRFEAAGDTTDAISRIRLGKKISDRLSVALTTDIDTKDAVQTILAEYLITDTLLISGSRSSDSQHEISGKLRFRLR